MIIDGLIKHLGLIAFKEFVQSLGLIIETIIAKKAEQK